METTPGHRGRFSILAMGILLTSVSQAVPAEDTAKAYDAPKIFDPDGTLHVPSFTLRQSDFVSEAFKQAYVENLKSSQNAPRIPAMNASREEWDHFDADADRFYFGKAADWMREHYPVDVVDAKIAGVHVAIVTPKDGIAARNEHRVLINVHGGAFLVGRGLVAAKNESVPIASIGKIKVIGLDYRMAPYYKFPAASEDVEAVYRELLKTYKPNEIGIYGCSAGGMLTAQSVAWFQTKNLPRPGAVGIFCSAPVPFGQLGDSRIWTLPGVPAVESGPTSAPPPGRASLRPTGYMEGADVNDPRAFPGSSSEVLAKFPPTLLISGTRAPDMSPAIVAHARFLKLGVDSYLYIEEGGPHGAYDTVTYATPEAHDTLAYVARWFDQHLAR
jgi:acetyl esterase/lipase